MMFPAPRILLPETVQFECRSEYLSLTRFRREHDRLEDALTAHLTAKYRAQIIERCHATPEQCDNDSITTILLGLALTREAEFFVAEDCSTVGHPIDPNALDRPIPGLWAWDSFACGYFIIAPCLMFHESREARSSGKPLFVKRAEISSLLGWPPMSDDDVMAILLDIATTADRIKAKLSADELIVCAMRLEHVRAVVNGARLIKLAAKVYHDTPHLKKSRGRPTAAAQQRATEFVRDFRDKQAAPPRDR